jgi:SAM-dependent methyltransferase
MIREILWMLRYYRREHISRGQINRWQNQIAGWFRFWRSYQNYQKAANLDDGFLLTTLYPCIGDDTAETQIEPTYFYQDAWAFEQIVKVAPTQHIDVGSHHKYVALLSKVLPVTMVDIRPLSAPLESLKFQAGTILDLPFADQSVESLSSLCVVEHIGLGRYGDPIDPEGTSKAIAELQRVIKPSGNLYISLPLDDENRTYFNAHRAFQEAYVSSLFQDFELIQARYIYEGKFGETLKSGFGTGCYHFRRL